MRGVTADITVTEKHQGSNSSNDNPPISFTIVSPLGNGVAEQDGPYNHKPKPMAPYWGVLLAPRSSKAKVNMMACSTMYKVLQPRLPNKEGRLAGFDLYLQLDVPMLINTVPLKEGDLLLLPCDGGTGSQCICKDDVAKHADSWQ